MFAALVSGCHRLLYLELLPQDFLSVVALQNILRPQIRHPRTIIMRSKGNSMRNKVRWR